MAYTVFFLLFLSSSCTNTTGSTIIGIYPPFPVQLIWGDPERGTSVSVSVCVFKAEMEF